MLDQLEADAEGAEWVVWLDADAALWDFSPENSLEVEPSTIYIYNYTHTRIQTYACVRNCDFVGEHIIGSKSCIKSSTLSDPCKRLTNRLTKSTDRLTNRATD